MATRLLASLALMLFAFACAEQGPSETISPLDIPEHQWTAEDEIAAESILREQSEARAAQLAEAVVQAEIAEALPSARLEYAAFDPETPACESALFEHGVPRDTTLLGACESLPSATQRCMMAPYRGQNHPECQARLGELTDTQRDALALLLTDPS